MVNSEIKRLIENEDEYTQYATAVYEELLFIASNSKHRNIRNNAGQAAALLYEALIEDVQVIYDGDYSGVDIHDTVKSMFNPVTRKR